MATTKFRMINTAQKQDEEMSVIIENINTFAASIDMEPALLLEGATQMLAGLKSLVDAGQPLAKAGMSPENIANVVSGLRVLVTAMPRLTDPQKQQRAQSILSSIQLGKQMSLGAVTALANLASKDTQADDLRAAFAKYGQGGTPNPELSKVLGQLQVAADQVSRAAGGQQQAAPRQAQQQAAPAKGTPQPAMTSGTVSTVGQNR